MIVLKDMKFSVLKSLIEFMYCGETNVTEDNLHALVEAAKFFEVIYLICCYIVIKYFYKIIFNKTRIALSLNKNI